MGAGKVAKRRGELMVTGTDFTMALKNWGRGARAHTIGGLCLMVHGSLKIYHVLGVPQCTLLLIVIT